MREQRQPRGLVIAVRRGGRGEPLVRGDVLHQAEQLGRERPLRHRDGAPPPDPRRHLDDVVIGKPDQRAAVAHIDYLHLAAVGEQRCDERDRRLAVERAASLLEQRRLVSASDGSR